MSVHIHGPPTHRILKLIEILSVDDKAGWNAARKKCPPPPP